MRSLISSIAPMRVFTAVLLFGIMVGLNAAARAAREEPAVTLTLASLIQRALDRSELIIARREFVEEIRWAKKQAGSWRNPAISLQGGMKQADKKNGYLYSIAITQPFLFPGKTGLVEDVFSADEKIAGLSLEETRLFIRYEVIRLTYEYTIAREFETHLKERVDRFKLIEEYMRNRPFVSPKKRMDRNIVQSRLLILQKILAELQSEKGIILSRLNLYVHVPENSPLALEWFKSGPVLDREALLSAALERNCQFRKQKAGLEKSKHELRLARRQALPDFDLTAFYNQDRAAGLERSFGAGITLYVPVVNPGRAAVKSIDARARAEQSEIEYAERLIRQDILALHTGYALASANLRRFPLTLIERAHAQLNDADNEFRRGTIDLLTYLEAETQAYESHLAVFNSQREFLGKYIALLMLAGSTEFKSGE